MSPPQTSLATPNVISSPASAAGPSPCSSQAGPSSERFGPDPALANLSARQAREQGLLTSGTSGRCLPISSSSADLQSLLESRLQAALLPLGSTLYKMTWKPWPMPSQRRRSRLRASAPRTSATDRTGWVTPTTRDWKDSGSDIKPRADGSERFDQLPRQAVLCGWPTATSCDSNRQPAQDFTTPNITLNHAAVLCGWPTPNSSVVDHKPRPPITSGRKPTDPQISTADIAVHLCGWSTPCAGDGKKGTADTPRTDGNWPRSELPSEVVRVGPARLTACGQLLIGSDAEMQSGGLLNPAHSRWLMGFPAEWCDCAPTATRSSRRKQPNSSALQKVLDELL